MSLLRTSILFSSKDRPPSSAYYEIFQDGHEEPFSDLKEAPQVTPLSLAPGMGITPFTD